MMSQVVKSWLKGQIAAVESVRTAQITPDGSLIAHTWSSGIISIYVPDDLPKPRHLKKLIQENTRVGVGSLFLVDAKHVPADGAQTAPDEALLALHALFRDKLYTYGLRQGVPYIGQVHFRAFNTRGDEREVWYGPDITVRNLPSYRVWVSSPLSVKGNWLVANFGNESFWKEADYTIGREAFRRQKREEDKASGASEPHFYTWSSPAWSNTKPDDLPPKQGAPRGYQRPPDTPRPMETELDRCYTLLGLTRTASSDDVKTAFRRLAREVHPDVSTLPKAEAEARFKRLNDAYTRIKAANKW